ncbi:MAG: hypothetical protein ACE5H1_08660 [Thermodesulfobacteriota bacterium]
MRITNNLGTIAKAIGIEVCILAIVGLVFLFQFDKAKVELVNKTRAIAETIGEQASSYFAHVGNSATSDEFYLFLDDRLGRKKLFDTFDIAPKFFSVVMKKDVETGMDSGYFMEDFNPERGYSVKNRNGVISVSVPFTVQETTEPFGIVKIDSDTKAILKKVLANNFLLYAAMLVVLNNQAFIFYLLLRRKKEVVFEKGYIKEHSLGSLRVMHKLLGDMIEDHMNDIEEQAINKENNKNVISITDIADKRKK